MADVDVNLALAGMRIVHTGERYRSGRNNISSVLQDLMYYAAREGIDFEKELDKARQALVEANKESPDTQ